MYFSTKSKANIAGDFIFIMLIIGMIIPSTRAQIMGGVNKIKAFVIAPEVQESTDAKQLTADDFNYPMLDLSGKELNLSDYKGKVIFLNLWATWCPPCVAEMPSIQNLYDEIENNENIQLVVLSNEKISKVQPFIQNKEFTFPVFSSNYQLPKPFETESIPTTFIISKSGKIIVREIGASDWGSSHIIETLNKLAEE